MKYWIFIANDKSWDWIKSQNIGEVENWAATKNGKVKRYFLKIQQGDLVIGYSSNNQKAFVALGTVESPIIEVNGEKVIQIRKTKEFYRPVSLAEVIKYPPFDKKLQPQVKLNITVIPLEINEYNKIIALSTNSFLDNYDSEECELNTSEIEISEALKLKPGKRNLNSSGWYRDSRISKAAIIRANYTCELSSSDNNHESFIAAYSNKNFVESHHLIPLKEQNDFEYSLDNALNIVALCPNCHKLVHYGNKSIRLKKILELFEKRGSNLKAFNVSKEDLIKMYE